MSERITQTEFANRIGVTRQRIGNLVRQGLVPLDENRKVIVEEAVANLRAVESQGQTRKMDLDAAVREEDPELPGTNVPLPGMPDPDKMTPKPGTPSTAVARAVHETYRARMTKLAYEKEAGLVVDREQVKRDAFIEGRAIRDALMSLGGRLRDRLAGESDPISIHKIIDETVLSILRELSEGRRTTIVDDLGI